MSGTESGLYTKTKASLNVAQQIRSHMRPLTMRHQPIQRRKLYQDVVERLTSRIRAGEWSPGDELPSEHELMEQYVVGRPAIREALQALERSGIVEINQGEKARVIVPTANHLMEQIEGGAKHLLNSQPDMLGYLKDARLFLETALTRMAAEKASAQDVEKLRACVDNYRAAVSDQKQLMACDMAIHCQIAAISGNPIYPAMVESIFRWASEYYRSMVRKPGRENTSLIEHEAICEAIASHDPARAEQAMRVHLTRANDLYRATDKAGN